MNVVSASADKTELLWRYEYHAWGSAVFSHDNWVKCCALSSCGSVVVTGSNDWKVRIWQEHRRWKEETIRVQLNVNGIEVSEDMILIVYGKYKYGLVIEREGAKWRKNAFRGHKNAVMSLKICEGNRKVFYASDDNTARVWDVRASKWETFDIDCHRGGVSGVEVNRNRIVSVGYVSIIIVWDLVDKEWKKRTFQGGGIVTEIVSDSHFRRLRLTSFGKDFDYYIERDGDWVALTRAEVLLVFWTESLPLQEASWPLRLAIMTSDWLSVYEVPGGEWFAVRLKHAP